MVAVNRDYPFTDYPPAPLPEDILAEVVDLRARGKSWEDTATAVQWDLADLRRAVRHDPNFAAAYALAEREVQQEADAEGMAKLRALLTDKKPSVALAAAKVIARYIAEKRRDETHLEVERLRAEARSARAGAKQTEAPPASAEPAPRGELELADAYLWREFHPVGDVPPEESDVRLRLHRARAPGGREFLWAVTEPIPAIISFGKVSPPTGWRPEANPYVTQPGDDAPPG